MTDKFGIHSQIMIENNIINENNGLFSIRRGSFKKTSRVLNRDLAFADAINENGGMPKNEEMVLIKTTGMSDTGSIFRYLLSNQNLDELYLSTWIISRPNIDCIINAIKEGKLKRCTFVVSIRLKQLKKSDYAYLVEQFLNHKDKINFKVCNSHAKTFSVSDFKGNKYTITGSGNWTENPRIENYIVLNDKMRLNIIKSGCKI